MNERQRFIKRLVGASIMYNEMCLNTGILYSTEEAQEQFTLDMTALVGLGVTWSEISEVIDTGV